MADVPFRPRSLSRRRFLVVVGGSGALLLSGRLGVERSLAAESTNNEVRTDKTPADGSARSRVQVVNVESGFVDATSWQGELLTLRPGPSSGMVIRAELTEVDYKVDVPDGFAGRCLGAHGKLLIIGGHRVVHTHTTTFEAGTSYESLLTQAGPEAVRLTTQPERPVVRAYQHEFVERFPALLVTQDLREWKHFDVPIQEGTGGSFGAVLERGGVLAADHYAFAEVPDSVVEASLISFADAVGGRVTTVRDAIPLDHGALWGASDTGSSGLVIVADRVGIRGYTNTKQVLLSLDGDHKLLGINPEDGHLKAAVKTRDGAHKIKKFRSGLEKETTTLADTALIKHRISPDVTIAAPDGKHALIPHTSIAQLTTVSTQT